MGAIRGALVGALGLVVLEVAITNADGVASLIQLVGGDGHPGSGFIGRVLSPDVAAIPNRTAGGTGRGGTASATPTAPAGIYPSPITIPPPVVAPAPTAPPVTSVYGPTSLN